MEARRIPHKGDGDGAAAPVPVPGSRPAHRERAAPRTVGGQRECPGQLVPQPGRAGGGKQGRARFSGTVSGGGGAGRVLPAPAAAGTGFLGGAPRSGDTRSW